VAGALLGGLFGGLVIIILQQTSILF